jgi:hypothetical protein
MIIGTMSRGATGGRPHTPAWDDVGRSAVV